MPAAVKQPTERRQSGLIAAALHLAAARSPADITTAELAAAVGLSQAAVFRHFPSKEALWLAVLDWVHARLMADLQRAAACAATPLAALRALVLAHADFASRYPGMPRLVFQELQHPAPTALKDRVAALMQDYRSLLREWLQRAAAQRLIAPESLAAGPEVLFLGLIQGLAMQAMLAGDPALITRQAPALVDVALAGLRPGVLAAQPADRESDA